MYHTVSRKTAQQPSDFSRNSTGSPFERFAATRPKFPLASENKSHFMPTYRDDALTMRYVQVGGHKIRWKGYLVFDIDRADAKDAWREASLPSPTFVVVNPKNGHAHLFYELAWPVSMWPIDDKTRWLRSIMDAYTNRLQADPRFVGLCAKNPLCERAWDVLTTDVRYDLPSLRAPLKKADFGRPFRSSGVGRNVDLFDWTRLRFAYATVREFDDESAFRTAVAEFAFDLNRSEFDDPLEDKEVRTIAWSVSKWTWEHRERYTKGTKRVRRGRMGFAPLPYVMDADAKLRAIRDRQAAAGRASAEAEKAATRARIVSALEILIGERKRASAAAVARYTGLGYATVKRHRDLLAAGVPEKVAHPVPSGLEEPGGAPIRGLVPVPVTRAAKPRENRETEKIVPVAA